MRNRKKEDNAEYDSEWDVMPGPGGWAIGWFQCKACGHKEAEDKDVCPKCKSRMKKVRWF